MSEEQSISKMSPSTQHAQGTNGHQQIAKDATPAPAPGGGGNVTVIGKVTGTGTITVGGELKVVGMVESPFLKMVRETFTQTNGGTQLWPPEGAMDSTPDSRELLAKEFADAIHAMVRRREDQSFTMPDGPHGSAKKLLKTLVEATRWPAFDNNSIAVPEPWSIPQRRDSFRRYEAACTVEIMMRAFHAKGTGTGGDTPKMPPDG